jgi:two-component system LytT family response regulator
MIRTLIIDDEENNRLRLKNLIREHFQQIEIIGEADGVSTGLEAINQLRPELLLLDIKMADGNAFDLLRQVESLFFKIIFVTAYEEYALRAFKYSALDYLLKPVSVEDLRDAFMKAQDQILTELKLQLSTMQNNLEAKKKTLVLRTSQKLYFIHSDRIVRCESDRNYTFFFTDDNKRYIVSQPLKDFEEILDGHGFFRIHKSHMINLDYIESFDKADGGMLVLKDKTELPVARRKKQELMEKIT